MFLLFFLAWVIFNGAVTTEILIFGVVIAFVMFAFICKFMDYSLQKELMLLRKCGLVLYYMGTLVVEILKANMTAIHFILTDKEIVEPVIVRFKTNIKSETLRMLLANSITLTPGTITVSLEEDELVVHCLDKTLAEGIEDSVFVKMLEKMERAGDK